MKIVVSSQGETLDAAASPVFGRCPTYVFVDTETMESEAVPNPAMNQGGGAGIQAAQFVVNQGAQAVLTGNLGPNAHDVLQAAGVPGYLVSEGTVGQAVEAYKAGLLQPMGGANVAAHAGMGRGMGYGMGRGMGMGMGRGQGMGRGMGMGMGRGMQPTAPVQPAPQAASEAELAGLHEMISSLSQQLAETMEKLEKLEDETRDMHEEEEA
jgi:predicted Fe-Mo cluster-binding NifX family protein